MIRLTSKITENDIERSESLHYIESLNDNNTFLDIKDPYARPKLAKKGTHMSGVYSEQ